MLFADLKVAGFHYRQCRNGYRHRREDIVSAPESYNHCRSHLHHDFAEFRRFSRVRTFVRAKMRLIQRDMRNFLKSAMPSRGGCLVCLNKTCIKFGTLINKETFLFENQSFLLKSSHFCSKICIPSHIITIQTWAVQLMNKGTTFSLKKNHRWAN